jgi:Kef-type K+ transport system membrane component KefB
VEHGIFFDIALCIITAWVVGVIGHLLKQPLLLAYLVAGYLIGPQGLKFITDPESIEHISHVGLTLLLFMIGLEIDLKKMVQSGRLIVLLSLAQIVGSFGIAWLIARGTGIAATNLGATYLGAAIALSSTVIIVKLLYDKRELETLSGRVTLGVLVMQDLAAILFLALQPNLKNPTAGVIAKAFGEVLVLVAVGYVAARFILPPIFRFVARLPEVVLVGALAWCFGMAVFAEEMGLSREMGALIAGVMVSTFPYTLDVVAKVTSIRDFFVTLFFVGLGMMIPQPTWQLMGGMLALSAILILTRILTVFPVLYFGGQGHRGSLIPTINLTQMSELSLVLLSLGVAAGDVDNTTLGMAAFAFCFLAVDSTYAILKSDAILRRTSPWLRRVGLRDLDSTASTGAHGEEGHGHGGKRIFMLGFFWTASSFLEEIIRDHPALLPDIRIIDFNPQVYARLRQRGVDVVYGDITQRDVLLHAGIGAAEVIVCSLPNLVLKGATNYQLLRQIRDLNPKAKIIMHAEQIPDVERLYAAGADYVSTPRLLEAQELYSVIRAAENGLLEDKRAGQKEQLQNRNEVLP